MSNVIDKIEWGLGVLQFHSSTVRAAPGTNARFVLKAWQSSHALKITILNDGKYHIFHFISSHTNLLLCIRIIVAFQYYLKT